MLSVSKEGGGQGLRLGFRVQGLGFRGQSSGFRGWGIWFRVGRTRRTACTGTVPRSVEKEISESPVASTEPNYTPGN